MAEWLIRVIGKRRKEIDKDLLVQAILALGRQLWDVKKGTEPDAGQKPEDAA